MQYVKAPNLSGLGNYEAHENPTFYVAIVDLLEGEKFI